MSGLKPIKLHSHKGGPNPWKVAIVMEELGVPYESEFIDFSVIKKEPFIRVNPNGRVPAIEDTNTGESGAIVNYLIDQYDKEHKISYASSPEKYYTDQWLNFQMSGQGPSYGQYIWFARYHQEQVESAKERYLKEILRVISVVDSHLAKTGRQYFVGDKCTYADLSFLPWGGVVAHVGIDITEGGSKNAAYQAWWDRLMARPHVQKVFADRTKAISGQAGS